MTERQKLFLLSARVSNCTSGWTLRTIDIKIKQVIKTFSTREGWWYIGIKGDGGVKSKGTRLLIEKSEVTRFLNVPLDVFIMTFMILQDSYMEPTRVGSDQCHPFMVS